MLRHKQEIIFSALRRPAEVMTFVAMSPSAQIASSGQEARRLFQSEARRLFQSPSKLHFKQLTRKRKIKSPSSNRTVKSGDKLLQVTCLKLVLPNHSLCRYKGPDREWNCQCQLTEAFVTKIYNVDSTASNIQIQNPGLIALILSHVTYLADKIMSIFGSC